MNDSSDKQLSLKANYIGPVLKLSSENGLLSSRRQNFIFATNGTGKSFIARSLRILDDSAYHLDGYKHSIPTNIVSQENDSGDFSINLGNECIGHLELNKISSEVQRSNSRFLFHVFSSDYIETELRQKEYSLDGNIEHEIILGRDNSLIDDKRVQLTELENQLSSAKDDLLSAFNKAKKQLKNNFDISANLREFKNLTFDACSQNCTAQDEETNDLPKLLTDYNTYKSLPSEPETPSETTLERVFVDFEVLDSLIEEEVSLSSVTEEIKSKIIIDRSFFQTGVKRYQVDPTDCHFCGQSLQESAIQLIDKYAEYFQDKEAEAKDSVIEQKKSIGLAIAAIEESINETLTARRIYDDLKQYFTSKCETVLDDCTQDLEYLKLIYSNVTELLDAKLENISSVLARSNDEEYVDRKRKIEVVKTSNEALCEELKALVLKSDGERLNLQRKSCSVFTSGFYIENESEFKSMEEQGARVRELEEEIRQLELVSGNKVSARSKVADTFEYLLNFMFGGKYQFDSERFVVQLGNTDMKRGGDKTLSDGEKSVLAFCYFLAQSHMRVESKEDYKNIFYIIDDPVSSLSFDYVYCIAQIIKNIRVSDEGIQFNSLSNAPRPWILVLTHNDYFYNVAATNNIFKRDSFFQLIKDDSNHKIKKLKGNISPHRHHLQHVYEVSAYLCEPNFSTPNSIRAVLEGLWKFYSPDLQDLSTFIANVISNNAGIQIRSILINDLSHGGKSNDLSPVLSDIELASQEAIKVVRAIAPGQINQIQ